MYNVRLSKPLFLAFDDDDESNLLPRGRVITQQSGSLPVYTKVTWEVLQSDMYISGGEYRVV